MIQREIFGPVITVQQFSDEDEAIAWAQRHALRPGRRRCGRATSAARCASPTRCASGLRVDQRPHPARLRDAARRLQAVRLRQGPVDVRARGLHRGQARDGLVGLTVLNSARPTPGGVRVARGRRGSLSPPRTGVPGPPVGGRPAAAPALRRPARRALPAGLRGGLRRHPRPLPPAPVRLHAPDARAARAPTPRTRCRTSSCAPTARCARTTGRSRCGRGCTASRTTAASTSCAARCPAPARSSTSSRTPLRDPLDETERREELRRLVDDVRRLPEQQRSALLMRELEGLSLRRAGRRARRHRPGGQVAARARADRPRRGRRGARRGVRGDPRRPRRGLVARRPRQRRARAATCTTAPAAAATARRCAACTTASARCRAATARSSPWPSCSGSAARARARRVGGGAAVRRRRGGDEGRGDRVLRGGRRRRRRRDAARHRRGHPLAAAPTPPRGPSRRRRPRRARRPHRP